VAAAFWYRLPPEIGVPADQVISDDMAACAGCA
jgi:hypothetical protein